MKINKTGLTIGLISIIVGIFNLTCNNKINLIFGVLCISTGFVTINNSVK